MTGQSDRDSFEIELAIEREMGRAMHRERVREREGELLQFGRQ